MSSSSDKYSNKLCEQRKLNGDPCQSPALRDKRFCHYHEHAGPPPIDINNADSNPSFHVYLPVLKDAASIQSAISEVCEMMLHRRIEPKEASALFYAMQVASSNLDHLAANKNQKLISNTNSDTSSRKTSENNSEKTSPAPDAQPSSKPDRVPLGTIQACAQRRRSVV
ncbi:MAG: hypothetical protein LAO30_16145, partial [Acidobacteriia bacterium]|nr:hypothetical protein [Terriglobia bacterium]